MNNRILVVTAGITMSIVGWCSSEFTLCMIGASVAVVALQWEIYEKP